MFMETSNAMSTSGCLPLRGGRACSSTSWEFLYLELPWDFLVFFLSERLANGSIRSTKVVDIAFNGELQPTTQALLAHAPWLSLGQLGGLAHAEHSLNLRSGATLSKCKERCVGDHRASSHQLFERILARWAQPWARKNGTERRMGALGARRCTLGPPGRHNWFPQPNFLSRTSLKRRPQNRWRLRWSKDALCPPRPTHSSLPGCGRSCRKTLPNLRAPIADFPLAKRPLPLPTVRKRALVSLRSQWRRRHSSRSLFCRPGARRHLSDAAPNAHATRQKHTFKPTIIFMHFLWFITDADARKSSTRIYKNLYNKYFVPRSVTLAVNS